MSPKGIPSWCNRCKAPRPASNSNFWPPTSTRVLGPNRSSVGGGAPVPRRVTRNLLCFVLDADALEVWVTLAIYGRVSLWTALTLMATMGVSFTNCPRCHDFTLRAFGQGIPSPGMVIGPSHCNSSHCV